jgi:hypothetical protein
MTEIQVFPAGSPPMPVAEPGETGGLNGLLAALHIQIGHLANRLPDPQRELLNESQALYGIRIDPIPIPLSGGAGTLDIPQMLGPKLGQGWDVHTISVTGFTAGQVQGWVNAAGIGAARYSQVAGAGVSQIQFYGKGQLWLRGNSERLVFTATGITGQPVVSVDATRVASLYEGRYWL